MTRAEAIGLLVGMGAIDADDSERRDSYRGVLNSYLEQQIALLGRNEPVVGDVEILEACPCCGYRTLDERGGYDICAVCGRMTGAAIWIATAVRIT